MTALSASLRHNAGFNGGWSGRLFKGGYGYFISNRTSDLDPESGRVMLGVQVP